MTSEVEEPQCIGCGEPEPRCCCEWLKLWQLRHDLGEQISVVLRQYWESADQYSEIVPSHIEALQYEVGEIEATNYPHEKMLAKIAALESELAALRQIAADVETCQQGRQLMVEGDRNRDFKHAKVGVLHDGCYKRFDAETWQAALHAAAEWVRAGGER